MPRKQTTNNRQSRTVNNKARSKSRNNATIKKEDIPKKDNSQRNYEIKGIAFVAIGIISLCGVFGLNVGFVGVKLAKFIQYFFGIGAVLFSIALGTIGGYYIMKHQKLHFSTKIIGSVFFIACSLAMYHHLVVKPGEEILPESLVAGGGLLGGIINLILHSVVGTDGTPILLGAGMLCSILVITTWSLAKGILVTKEKAEKGADVAKKATAVVYDKTIEVGTVAKEHVQEYVQEHVEDVGQKLKKFRGKDFLARYEKDSAFLNDESHTGARTEPTTVGKNSEGHALGKAAGTTALAGIVGVASTSTVSAQNTSMSNIVENNELVEANPVAMNFFGEKFSSDVEPEELPSLASQLGLGEKPAASEMPASHAFVDSFTVADDEDSVECAMHNVSTKVEELSLGEDIDWNSFDLNADMADITEHEMEPIAADTMGETETGPEAISDTVDVEPIREPQDEYAYDYGIESMEITYPQDAANITDITEYDEDMEAEEDAFQPEELAPKAATNSTLAMPMGSHPATTAESTVGEAKEEAPPPYIIPSINLLSKTVKVMSESLNQEIADNAKILGETLANFKVKASILNACHGPAVTRYEVKPAPGVKVSKITGLADDIALNMAATAVRIEQIPGKAAIGIEVPNRELESVQLREVLENPAFAAAKSRLTVGLGKDISGQAIFADLAKMPHLLVAGATGSGKSVCINTLITSILFKAKPTEVKFILIDPKMVELSVYNDIPHLMVPVVTDSKKAASVLNWAVQEMEKRYGLIAQAGVRNMEGYNKRFEEEPEKKLPSIVIIIDELADLMMVAPHDVEDAICRIAQKARAAGIYLVLATQRPSVNVITGVIKANIPSRISFAVTSQIDSRTILDASGAEKLLGKGDMLFKPQEANKATRIQGAFVSDKEVELLVDYIKSQGHKLEANQEIIDFTNKAAESDAEEDAEDGKTPKAKMDSLLRDAVELVMSSNNASASSFQRRYHIGYSRAGRLLDTMEQLGIVGPPQGSKPREILVTEAQAFEIMDNYEVQ